MNKIMLIGNLGKDPDMSYTPGGKAVTKFSLAVNRRTKDAKGEYVTETQWFNCTAWERLAETINTYLHKGSKVYIEGRMSSHKYTDKENVTREAWEVTVSEMEMLTPKGEGGNGSGGGSGAPVNADDLPF